MHSPLLYMVDAEGTTTLSSLTAKISMNIKMLANTFTNDDHCMSAATNFPTIALATIIDKLNFRWLRKVLDDNMGSLNKFLIVLNFCRYPAKPGNRLHYSSISRSITTVHIEHDLDQDVLQSKPKSSDSLVRGQQSISPCFITLLANLIANFMCCMQLQMKSNHEPQISWFLRELPKVFMKLKFRACHEKHQVTCPWLTRTHMLHLHPAFTLLGTLVYAVLTRISSQPRKTITWEKYVSQFEISPASC